MKTLGKLKLTQLSKAELEKKELNQLIGGYDCCQCNCQTSSTSGNISGNIAGKYHTGSGTGILYDAW